MQYITFISHDRALMLDRLQKMLIIMSCLCVVVGLDVLSNPASFTPITAGAAFVVQLLCAKYWADMIVLRNPWKNCWEFKEK